MKHKQIIYIILLIQITFTNENIANDRQLKASEMKRQILNKNLLDSTFQKHPEYIRLKHNLKLELKNLRSSHFKNDSLYKNEVKFLKAKNDSFILKLFRELIKN